VITGPWAGRQRPIMHPQTTADKPRGRGAATTTVARPPMSASSHPLDVVARPGNRINEEEDRGHQHRTGAELPNPGTGGDQVLILTCLTDTSAKALDCRVRTPVGFTVWGERTPARHRAT